MSIYVLLAASLFAVGVAKLIILWDPASKFYYNAPRFVKEYPPKLILLFAVNNYIALTELLIKVIYESSIYKPETELPIKVLIYYSKNMFLFFMIL